MSPVMRKHVFGAVQPQKIARALRFWILKGEGLYHLYSEKKGADQLHSYCWSFVFACAKIWFCHDALKFCYSACLFATRLCTMIKDKNQKGVKKKQGEEGEESELQKHFDLEVIKTIYTKVSIKRGGRGKNLLRMG